MPDLNDDLFSSFRDEGPTVNPLPATEVRRRGDRLRRRNNTLAAVGGVAAALVVIATPLAVVANGGSDDSSRPPIATETGQVSWRQEIPASLDVSAGIQGADASQDPKTADEAFVSSIDVCDDRVFDADVDTVDVAGAQYSEPLTSNEVERTLALYPDGDTAQAAVESFVTAADACGTVDAGTVGDTVEWAVTNGTLPADQSYVVTSAITLVGEDYPTETVFYVVARTGNAVLLTEHSRTALQGDEVQAEQDDVADVVAGMQVFSETAAIVPETDGTAALGATIPDDFDLLAGFPEDDPTAKRAFGREGPARDLDLTVYNVSLEACGVAPTGLPTPTDTHYAGWRETAGGQLRQLMTFASADEAQAYADALLQVYADCPEDTDEFGATKVYELAPDPRAGDFAGSVVMHYEADGEVGPGYQVVQVVRVGQAVLQFVATYEGGEPVDPATAVTDLTTTYLNANGAVIDAM